MKPARASLSEERERTSEQERAKRAGRVLLFVACWFSRLVTWGQVVFACPHVINGRQYSALERFAPLRLGYPRIAIQACFRARFKRSYLVFFALLTVQLKRNSIQHTGTLFFIAFLSFFNVRFFWTNRVENEKILVFIKRKNKIGG